MINTVSTRRTNILLLNFSSLYCSLIFVLTCVFLWFCVLILPHRRRQNLKALIRVKSYINENYSPKGSLRKCDIHNSDRNMIDQLSKVSDTFSLEVGKKETNLGCDDKDLYKSINVKDNLDISKDERIKNAKSSNEPPKSTENYIKLKTIGKYIFGYQNLTTDNEQKPETGNLQQITQREKCTNDTQNKDKLSHILEPLDEANQKSNETTSMSNGREQKLSFYSYDETGCTKGKLTKEEDALQLRVSSDMLRHSSLQNIKKFRKETVFEGPWVSTYL